MNTFAGVKKANARRAIYVDRALENSCELLADYELVSDYEEGLDVAAIKMHYEVVASELMQEWEQIQATFRNIQSIEINAETRAAMLSRLSRICPPMVPNILEVPRSLVAKHSPPNLSRHLSSNAPPASMRAQSRAALVST